ncbi:hypothetical protein LJC33_08855 [Eubacteriales bacterium OttesenSCG-928-N13]|nr:hypothetical protein [Eubacteriales bacterium OttesenSCG-928-N13]
MNEKPKHYPDAIRIDFSKDSTLRDPLRQRLQTQLDQHPIHEEIVTLQKKPVRQSMRVLLVAITAIVLMSGIALAAMRSLSLGPFATYTSTEIPDSDVQIMKNAAAELNGTVYDRDGALIEDFWAYVTDGNGKIYDAQGIEQDIKVENGKIVQTPHVEPELVKVHQYDTMDNIKSRMNFAVALPETLPQGYALQHFEMFQDTGNDYLTIQYGKDGEEDSTFRMHLRLMNEETAFMMTSNEEMHEAQIAGHPAILREKGIDMLIGDVMYSASLPKSGMTMEELMQLFESIPST